MRLTTSDSEMLVRAYVAACEEELQAFKPGNVSVYSEGHDMTVEDFRLSAQVSAPYLVDSELALGEKIFYATQVTGKAVGCNTNLGILLLCAPLIEAVQRRQSERQSLRNSLSAVLKSTTLEDAAWTYKAILLASPGGLGNSEREDVRDAPEVRLTEAMRIASNQDRIAYQYVSDYSDIFDFAVTRYNRAINQWGDERWAAVSVFVGLLCRFPDSHIERKFGNRFTGRVAAKMALLEAELSNTDRPERLWASLREADAEFKSAGINPGTTADLTVATSLSVRLDKLISVNEVRSTGL
ncbi:MAG: triphosphoribosyl-dephospho-CoA synthase [Pseudomonadota bacterium]